MPFKPLNTACLAATALTSATLCVAGAALAQTKTVVIDGSSTVFPVSEAIAEEFQKSTKVRYVSP